MNSAREGTIVLAGNSSIVNPKTLSELIRMNSGYMKHRFIYPALLYKMVNKISGKTIGISTFYRLSSYLVDSGVLKKVIKGLYVNMMAVPRPSAMEAASIIHPGCVISLHSILAECGALNNPSVVTTCIVPTTTSEWRNGVVRGRMKTGLGEFWFSRVSADKVYPKGLDIDDIIQQGRMFQCATPEKALADWLYIGRNNRSSRYSEPPLDIDLSRMSMARLKKICRAMRIQDRLESYLERKMDYDESDSVRMNMNPGLGF